MVSLSALTIACCEAIGTQEDRGMVSGIVLTGPSRKTLVAHCHVGRTEYILQEAGAVKLGQAPWPELASRGSN